MRHLLDSTDLTTQEIEKIVLRAMDIIDHPIFWTSDDICHIPMPVDVYEVYKEYGYADPRSLS